MIVTISEFSVVFTFSYFVDNPVHSQTTAKPLQINIWTIESTLYTCMIDSRWCSFKYFLSKKGEDILDFSSKNC